MSDKLLRSLPAALMTVLALIAGALPGVIDATPAAAAESQSLVPYEVPPTGSDAEPRVFSHYFPPYPLSLDNRPPATDYYTRNYLSVDGEGGIHRAYGGLLRDRPLKQDPVSGANWRKANLIKEVNQAADAGIDGFFVDVLSLSGSNWTTTVGLFEAASESGRRLVVTPQIDGTTSASKATTSEVATKMAQLAKIPSAFRLPTGEFVLTAFKAEGKPVSWWADVISRLEQEHGIPTAFMPVFLDAANMPKFAAISYGAGIWGNRNPSSELAAPNHAAEARRLGLKWVHPISVQDSRPRGKAYWEARNLAQLRASWSRAIGDRADYVVLNTWNDYSETTSFAPSEGHDWTFLDVNGYYAAQFKTGSRPAILRDALYLTHRKQPHAARPQLSMQLQELRSGSRDPAQDTVEVTTFLTAPASLVISVGGRQETVSAAAGVNSYTVPLGLGAISVKASRNGVTVASTSTGIAATNSPPVQDLQYFGAGSLRQPSDTIASDSQPPTTPSGLVGTVGGNDVALSWTRSSDNVRVTGYRIERAGSGSDEWSLVREVAGTQFTDRARPDGRWRYRVRAADAAGNSSQASNVVDLQVGAAAAPPAPVSLAGEARGYRAHLNWQSGGGTTVSYQVERSASGTDDWTVVGLPTTPEFLSVKKLKVGDWYYRVAAANAAGLVGPYSSVVRVDVLDTSAPLSPTNLSATLDANRVALSWTQSTDNVGVAGYSVERSATGSDGWSEVARTTSTNYTDVIGSSETWFYRVSATDAAGNVSLESNTVGATAPDTVAPDAPTALEIAQSGQQAVLTWVEAKDISGVAFYVVERSADGVEGWSRVGSPVETTFTDTLQLGSKWFYRVAAVDPAGNESLPSDSVQSEESVPTPLDAVAGLAAAVEDRNVNLTWEPVQDDFAVAKYRVERSPNGTDTWTQIHVTKTTGFTDSGRPVGTWYYRITAADTKGHTAPASDVVTAVIVGQPPQVPTGLLANVVDYDVHLFWDAAHRPVDEGEYVIERAPADRDEWLQLSRTGTVDFVDSNRPVGTWRYRVVAVSAEGVPSEPSETVNAVVVDVTAPSAPGSLTGAADGYDVALTWSPASDNVAVAGYRVERSMAGTDAWADAGSASEAAFTDPSRPVGAWLYRVSAVDEAGNSSEPIGPTEVQVKDTTAPSSPAGLKAEVNRRDVSLQWNAASDNVAVTGYRVQRSAQATGGWTQIAEVAATAYVDKGRPVGRWWYRVVAMDGAGNVSAPSANASVTVRNQMPARSTVTLAPSKDSYVRSDKPGDNFGSLNQMQARYRNPALVSYLGFSLPAAPAGTRLAGATLKVWTTDVAVAGSVNSQVVSLASGDWSENRLVWTNRPAVGAKLGVLPKNSQPSTQYSITLDASKLRSLLGGRGTLALTTSVSDTDTFLFWSKEFSQAAKRPALILRFEPVQ